MLTALGLCFDILGFVILYLNGNFERNFNRIKGVDYGSLDDNEPTKVTMDEKLWPKVWERIGFSSIVFGFLLQLFPYLCQGIA